MHRDNSYLIGNKFAKGHRANKTSFKKGMIPWNKGTRGVMKINKTSIRIGQHLSIKTEFVKDKVLGENNWNWKGDTVGYYALHTWVYRHLGKPKICSHCGTDKKVQWANKSYKYKRESDDWLEFCYWCHRKYDSKNGWGIASEKFPEIKNRKEYYVER